MNARHLLLCLLSLGLLAPQALATWSIVVMDRRTGEVGVASATCIANFDLRGGVPLIVVGKGAAAHQSALDNGASNRREARMMIQAGYTPIAILNQLAATDGGHQSRQYGFVTSFGAPVTFSGSGAGQAKFGVTGSIGDFDYAIQGNVLTGNEVILAAEQAFRNLNGDMSERMMAGMEGAMALGGDGRCSCTTGGPTGCGSPPVSFTHSAYTGFVIVARPGDTDGDCSGNTGCANGDYYLNLNFVGNASTLDPVIELRNQFDAWRLSLAGVPDHILSSVQVGKSSLIADGADQTTARVRLIDGLGQPLTQGVSSFEVLTTSGNPIAIPGSITDHADGSYSFPVTASLSTGRTSFGMTAVLANGDRIRLTPDLSIEVRQPAQLVLGATTYSSAEGSELPMSLSLGANQAGRPYRILASADGTYPGTLFNGIVVPLNRDVLFNFTENLSGGAPFAGSVGTLDAQGKAQALWDLPEFRMPSLIGKTMRFSAVIFTASGPRATAPASILYGF